MKKLIQRVTDAVESRGARGTATVKSIDGRRIRIRAAYAALNSLLQSCGAVVCKLWLVAVMREVKKRGLDVTPCGNIHDEIQAKVADKDIDEYCEICEEAMVAVGEAIGFRCPLAAESKVGPSWAWTH